MSGGALAAEGSRLYSLGSGQPGRCQGMRQCLLEEAPAHCNSWMGSWGTGNSVQRGLEKHSLEARNVCPFSRQI